MLQGRVWRAWLVTRCRATVCLATRWTQHRVWNPMAYVSTVITGITTQFRLLLCDGEYEERKKLRSSKKIQLQHEFRSSSSYPLLQLERRSRTFVKVARKPQYFCKRSVWNTKLCFALPCNCFWKNFFRSGKYLASYARNVHINVRTSNLKRS